MKQESNIELLHKTNNYLLPFDEVVSGHVIYFGRARDGCSLYQALSQCR